MPQIIKHIDAIARQKQRDVLFIVFAIQAVKSIMDENLDGEIRDEADFFALRMSGKNAKSPKRCLIGWMTIILSGSRVQELPMYP